MESIDRLNQAISYIEENLHGNVSYDEISNITLSPISAFQRFFSLTTGMTLAEYIRRRKLSRAANDVLNTDEKIIDIAMKYGYGSADAFSVAFKREYDVSPLLARQSQINLESFHRLHYILSIKQIRGDAKMSVLKQERLIETISFNSATFDIIERPETLWVGTMSHNDDGQDALRRFQELCPVAPKVDQINPDWTADISINFNRKGETLPRSVMYGQETYSSKNQDERYDLFTSPSGLYMSILNDEKAAALFCAKRIENHMLIDHIVNTVAPQNGYRLRGDIDLTFEFHNGDICYVYVAIEKYTKNELTSGIKL